MGLRRDWLWHHSGRILLVDACALQGDEEVEMDQFPTFLILASKVRMSRAVVCSDGQLCRIMETCEMSGNSELGCTDAQMHKHRNVIAGGGFSANLASAAPVRVYTSIGTTRQYE